MRMPTWSWLVAVLGVGALILGSLVCALAAPTLFRDLILLRIGDLERDLPHGIVLFAVVPVLFVGALLLKTVVERHKGSMSRGWPLPSVDSLPSGGAPPHPGGRHSAPDRRRRGGPPTDKRALG
jgi:hypothetical protein